MNKLQIYMYKQKCCPKTSWHTIFALQCLKLLFHHFTKWMWKHFDADESNELKFHWKMQNSFFGQNECPDGNFQY